MSNIPKNRRISEDFCRDVWSLAGLPIDNLTIESTKSLLREKAGKEGCYVLSTLNINWLVQSFQDKDFREAIINSDIVTLDGKPLFWLAKVLGLPVKEVVAGSTLMEKLTQENNQFAPLKLFLFGSEEKIASLAMEKVNKRPGGLRVVGYLNPGFGTVEEMSTAEIIEKINSARPDILLVALGAKKGTRWIEHNRKKLHAKVISHLGATIHFLAGTVARAPKALQDVGLEWAWRVLQEPKLIRRYVSDALALMYYMFSYLMARIYRVVRISQKRTNDCKNCPSIYEKYQENEFSTTLTLGKNLSAPLGSEIRTVLSSLASMEKNLIFNFQFTDHVGRDFFALLTILSKYQKQNGRLIEYRNIPFHLRYQFRHLL